ncbi:MAG TPA: LysM peptidoglycan-binding domain-containing protein [Anaerolineales bacterium]|nr:LysM peptidoglycan-binding domain-containing protein [Anaerolineales bacterium]
MQALRQLGVGVIIAIASVILVLGGIFLSLAETLPAPATPTQIPPTLPLSFPTPTATETVLVTVETVTETTTASPTATIMVLQPTTCTPPTGWVKVTTSSSDTIYSLAQRYKTSAESLSAANCLTSFDVPVGFALYVPPVPTVTVIPCGPPAGWVRGYTVQRGDTLYRIALSYGLTFTQLQRANCMGSSTTIYSGQRLYVPNIPTRTPVPGVTVVPDFPTETSIPTITSIPPTNTPTDPPPPTATDPPTPIPTFTNTPVTPASQ